MHFSADIFQQIEHFLPSAFFELTIISSLLLMLIENFEVMHSSEKSTFLEINSYKHLFLDREIDIKTLKMSFGKWYGEKLKMKISPSLTQKSYIN